MDSIQPADLYGNLSLQRLQVFVAVVDHVSFSAAAAFLNLGQSTVSFHVHALEQVLGAKLLVYRQRRVQPTAAGNELYRVASAILRDTERAAATIHNLARGQAGELRVGISIAFELPVFFERVIAPFRHSHPDLRLVLEFGHSVQLAEAVLDRQLDLAYVNNWRLPNGVHYQRLHDVEFVLMAARTHPLARKKRVTIDEVAAAGLITAPLRSQESPHYDRLLREAGLTHYATSLEIDGVQARLLATQAGLGVMAVFVPPYAMNALTRNLRPLRLGVPPPLIEFGVVTLTRDEPASVAAQEFIATLTPPG